MNQEPESNYPYYYCTKSPHSKQEIKTINCILTEIKKKAIIFV